MNSYYIEFYMPKERTWFDRIIDETTLFLRLKLRYSGKIRRDKEGDDLSRGRFYFWYLTSDKNLTNLKNGLKNNLGIDVKTVQVEDARKDTTNFQPPREIRSLSGKVLGIKD